MKHFSKYILIWTVVAISCPFVDNLKLTVRHLQAAASVKLPSGLMLGGEDVTAAIHKLTMPAQNISNMLRK